jgi:hypothetical protein
MAFPRECSAVAKPMDGKRPFALSDERDWLLAASS